MTFKDILLKAAEIIGDDGIDLETESKKRTRLIASGNMIYHELTTEYIQLKNREKLQFSNSRIYFSSFAQKVKDVLGVYLNGFSVPFRMYPLYLEAEVEGTADINYLYHAPELELEDNVILPPQYTALVLASGVASEYFYRTGLSDEAVFYKNRYDTAILNLSRIRKGTVLKVRRMI